ncbi:PPP4R4 [Mytilus edulis]|uniref:PPP4R4 n=1 Tax=Mytilus edulis TaxID=6550 RepID=A0A8S3U5T2_MYTED|nr:PPP4R4 [Mytilus edulis]
MDNLSCLIKCCSSDVLYQKVIPIVYPKIKSARALPVKHAACRSALKIIRKIKKLTQREELIHCFVEDFCHGRSCHHRSLFVDVCKNVIELYSKTFFKEYFYEYVLELQSDKVPNAVDELDKIHVQMEPLTKRSFFEHDLVDQAKEEEEKLLITNEEKEIKKEEEAAEKQKSKGDKKGNASAKKSENGGSKIPAPKKGIKATSTTSSSSGSSTQVSSKASGSKLSSSSKTKPPSSAGTTRRASEGGNTVTQRRGSMSSASSTGSTESATVKSKGSNGLLTVPSTKVTRKKSK